MAEPRHCIVIALDLGEYAEIVLEHALDQAARHERPDLHFIYVHERTVLDLDDAKQKLAALVLPALEELDYADWRIRLHVRAGKAPEAIAELAGEVGAHLIVLGRFGTHHPHRRIGTVAGRVIDLAPCATLVVALAGSSEATVQCPDCVAARASSDGARWFCAAHAGDRARLSTIVMPGSSWLGGLMW